MIAFTLLRSLEREGSSTQTCSRGKYAGVKVHLDGEECKGLIQYEVVDPVSAITFVVKLRKKIKALLAEEPLLLEDRTEEQVQAALLRDQEKITKQLKAMETGKDWKF